MEVIRAFVNRMIVLPMLLQTTTFGFKMKHLQHNDSRNAIGFAGILLLAAGVTLLIREQKAADAGFIAGNIH